MTKKKSKVKPGQVILLIILTLFTAVCILPIILVLIASFVPENTLELEGFTFFPSAWTLDAWKYIWTMKDQILRSYGVTIFITVFGVFSSLFLNSMLAYTLARKQFKLRNFLNIFILITMLFSGGQLSSYMINTSVYHLKDTIWVLCIPGVGGMTVFMMRTYIQSNITDSLIESAKIDGAGEFSIYWQICIPLMPPMLAALGFMSAVSKWNEWQGAMLYISKKELTPLQLLLMRIQSNLDMLNSGVVPSDVVAILKKDVPATGVRMALLFVVLGPIMVAYPFFEKYFVKGLTLGAVKG